MRKTATEQPLHHANTATYTEEYNNITSPSYQTSPEANSIAKPEEEFSKTNLNNASIENVDEDLDKLDAVEETDATTLEAEKEPAYLSENVEDAAEVQRDETLRTDAEILGKHYPIRQLTEKAGNARMGAIEYTKASWENAKDTPGLIARHLAFKLAESSYNRRKNKVDQVAHLSDNHPLKRFRMKKLAKAEARLNRRKASFENRRNQMFGRLNEVKSNSLKNSLMIKRTKTPTPIVIYISTSCTARMFPNKIWNKSVELFATLIKITPNAKNELNVIPIAVSLLIIELPLINVMIIDANNPNTIAPMKKSIPRINDRATPGSTA